MNKDHFCEVVSKSMLNEDTALIEFLCPEIAQNAVPGQFVNVACSNVLRRPFGVASVDKDMGTFKVGIKIIGEGTEELASMEEGEGTWVLGPLGNGLERFLDHVYSPPIVWIGNAFFEGQMTVGNVPLGIGLLLLVVILYAFLGGTIIYLICKLSSVLSRGKQ